MTTFLALLPAVWAAAQDAEVVRVNGTPIRQPEVVERLWKRYGDETVEEMIDELLLRQAAQKAGLTATAAEVDRRLGRVRAQFSDDKLFETHLAGQGLTVDKLKADLRELLLREKVVAARRKLSVSEAEVAAAFQARKASLGRPEGVRLRHLLVATRAEADAVVAAVGKGADFGALAKERSLAPTGKINGGDYGYVSKGMLPADVEREVLALQPGQTKILTSGKGVHVFLATDRRPALEAKLPQVKDDLRETLLQEKIQAAVPETLAELRAAAEITGSSR